MKNPVDLKNKTLTLDISKILKNSRADLSEMTETEKLKYIMSHLGMKTRVSLRRIGADRAIPKASKIDSTIDNRMKNYFLNLQRESVRVGTHRPASDARYFGVEIECLIPFDSLEISPDDYSSGGTRECGTCEGSGTITYRHRESGHEQEGECPDCDGSGEIDSDDGDNESEVFEACKSKLAYKIKAFNIKGVDIKSDGSIDGDSDTQWAVELTVLFRQDDMKNLEKLCSLLNELEAEVNASCGLHVHIDARHMTEKQVIMAGHKFNSVMPFLAMMVPKSRSRSNYCKLGTSKIDGDRYYACNLTAFKKYKTIEIRLHSSTTSFIKISNWIKVLSGVMSIEDLGHHAKTLEEFYNVIGADDDLQNYIVSRVQKFNGTAEETENESAETEDETLTIELGA